MLNDNFCYIKMGLEHSRAEYIPHNVDSEYVKYRESWRSKEYLVNNPCNNKESYATISTLSEKTLQLVGHELADFFTK